MEQKRTAPQRHAGPALPWGIARPAEIAADSFTAAVQFPYRTFKVLVRQVSANAYQKLGKLGSFVYTGD